MSRRVSDEEVAECCNSALRHDPQTGRGSIIVNLARDLRDCRAALAVAEKALRKARKALRGDEYAESAEGAIDQALSTLNSLRPETPPEGK